jgi:cell division protein FtsI (penicillin-binding protein 3)
VLLVVMSVAFAGIAVRLTLVQGLSWRQYAELGVSQRLRQVSLPAARGSVLDRNGAALAMSMTQRTVVVNPRLVTDPAAQARALAVVLKEDENVLREKLSAGGTFVYVARQVSDAVAARIEALHLPGIFFIDEPKRFTPSGRVAATLVGQVGIEDRGLTGLELQFEPRLRGTPGELLVERDPTGREIASGIRRLRAPERGEDLVLTIDRALQYQTEEWLAAKITETSAEGGTAIVMDPRTGEVLSMASLVAGPEGQPPQPAPNNLAVTSVYEPGSVNKVITIAAALEEGVVRPSDTFTVDYRMPVGGNMFSDHDRHDPQRWTVTDIVANSSNIGTIMIGQDLGKHRLDRYLRAFGLGSTTALRFPGESAGLLIDPEDWSAPSIGTVPIGQGLAVTSLQMLGAYNTVANGGVYVAPKLVKRTVDAHGVARDTKPSARRRVVSTRTAQQMTAMLTEVTRVGTGKEAHIDGYSVAGKTGTAKKPEEGGLGYRDGAYVATFAGFVPAEAPRLSVIVALDEPEGTYYGGVVAAPVFADVARYALRLLHVPPATPTRPSVVPRLRASVSKDADVESPPLPTTPATPTTLATFSSPQARP